MKPETMDLSAAFGQIERKISDYKKKGLKLFCSSSFQSHSIPLLHILSRVDDTIPVYFLNTGYHFPETLSYKDQIARLLGIQVIDVTSPITKLHQKDASGNFFFSSDPDYCCYLNKVLPLEPILKEKDVWISGVRRDQTKFRENLEEEVPGAHDTLRYHPILEWNAKMIWAYRKEYALPSHPLEEKGYLSIGCLPCTSKYIPDTPGDRNGRWNGMHKSECGIHTELTNTK